MPGPRTGVLECAGVRFSGDAPPRTLSAEAAVSRRKRARGRGPPARREAAKRVAASPASAPGPRFARRENLAALALAALAVGCYLPALSAGFVWDDEVFTDVAAIRDWGGLWRIWFSPSEIENEGHYWPLVYTSFWLEHKLWGFAPAGYHAVNVLLHAANALLVWRLAERLAVPGAWLVAAVFVVHPLHVESVAWIIERKDLLSGLFYLAAFLAWLRFADEPRGGRGGRHYVLALALFVAGMLCKSIVVTLPAAFLIVLWWKRGRVTGGDLLRTAPFFVVGAAMAAADMSFYDAREPLSLGYTAVERLLIAAHALWFYAGKLLWPGGLAVIYPHWETGAGEPVAWGYVVATVAVAAALWFLRGRVGRGPLSGVLFFAVTLSPVLGFVDYGYMQFSFVADRHQYLAGMGLMAVLVGAAAGGAERLPATMWRRCAAGAAAAVLAVLAVLTWRHAGVYRDEVTLFTHVVAHNPEARGAQQNLGKALLDAGRPEEALAASRAAVEREPDDVKARANAGVALIRMGRLEEAEARLRGALALDPRHSVVLQNLAESLRKQERFDEALGYYRAAIEADPGNALPHAGMGHVLFGLGRYEDALRSLDRALALAPGLESVRTMRDSALSRLGRAGAR